MTTTGGDGTRQVSHGREVEQSRAVGQRRRCRRARTCPSQPASATSAARRRSTTTAIAPICTTVIAGSATKLRTQPGERSPAGTRARHRRERQLGADRASTPHARAHMCPTARPVTPRSRRGAVDSRQAMPPPDARRWGHSAERQRRSEIALVAPNVSQKPTSAIASGFSSSSTAAGERRSRWPPRSADRSARTAR